MHIMRNHQGFINLQKQNASREREIKGKKHVSLEDKDIFRKEEFDSIHYIGSFRKIVVPAFKIKN